MCESAFAVSDYALYLLSPREKISGILSFAPATLSNTGKIHSVKALVRRENMTKSYNVRHVIIMTLWIVCMCVCIKAYIVVHKQSGKVIFIDYIETILLSQTLNSQ